MTFTRKIADDIYLIDANMYSIPGFASVYLVAAEKPVLIETGLPTSAETILSGLRQIGVSPADIAYIMVTHVHIDHAGGAGTLLAHMPCAQVLAHEKGAKHLVNPVKLNAAMGELSGGTALAQGNSMVPIAADRVRAVKDGEVVELGGGHNLEVIYSPGHARHHLCIYDMKHKALFTGDAAGIAFHDENVLIPATPPPDFDLELSINSVRRLMEQDVQLLLFSHFGVTRKVRETLEKVIRKLQLWGDITRAAAEEGSLEKVVDRLRVEVQRELAPLASRKDLCQYQEAVILPLSASGYISYFAKKGK